MCSVEGNCGGKGMAGDLTRYHRSPVVPGAIDPPLLGGQPGNVVVVGVRPPEGDLARITAAPG